MADGRGAERYICLVCVCVSDCVENIWTLCFEHIWSGVETDLKICLNGVEACLKLRLLLLLLLKRVWHVVKHVWNVLETLLKLVWNSLRHCWNVYSNCLRQSWSCFEIVWNMFETVWNGVGTCLKLFLNLLRHGSNCVRMCWGFRCLE